MKKNILLIAVALMMIGFNIQAQTSKKVVHKTYSSSITPQILAQKTYEKYDKYLEFTEEQKSKIMPILEKFSAEKINAKAKNDSRSISDIEKAEYEAIIVHFTEVQIATHGAIMAVREGAHEANASSRK